MKYLVFLIICIVLGCNSSKPESTSELEVAPGLITESELFAFYNPFWLNLHHFLHHQVLLRDTARVDVFEKAWMDQLSQPDRSTVREVVDFYQQQLVDQDLRRSDYMTAFKRWSGQQPEAAVSTVPDSFRTHMKHLSAFAPIYRQHFWPEHQRANREILEKNLALIQKLETQIAGQLEEWTQTDWQEEKIRIDITYYAKSYRGYARDRPFTTLGPTHVVMNANGHSVAGNWLEMLFHESSHHLIHSSSGFVGETLHRAAAETGRQVPRDLWHAYLFYFSGRVSQRGLQQNCLPEYEMYMVRNRVFRQYYPYLEQFLPDYLAGKTSLLEASKQLITAFTDDHQ